MIDLDDQLAAYVTYLDDTERSVTVLHPRAVTAESGSARWLAIAAAAVLVVAGSVAIATIRSDDDGAIGSTDSEWTVVPDPDGAFVPPPGGSVSNGGGEPIPAENEVRVSSVVATDDGFVAVGFESHAFTYTAAMWRSADGTTWNRTPHHESFGSESASTGPRRQGLQMTDVAVRGTTTVAVGSAAGSTPPALIWTGDGGGPWERREIGALNVSLVAVAQNESGFVVAGAELAGDTDSADVATGWFSTDAAEWQKAEFEDAWGSRVLDVVAFNGGFVAAGTSGGSPAIWTSQDGLTWQSAEAPRLGTTHSASVDRLVVRDDLILGVGGGSSPTLGYGTDRTVGTWLSTDGRTWHAIDVGAEVGGVDFPGPVLATADEFVVFAADLNLRGFEPLELWSPDGLDWHRRGVDAPGFVRDAAAYRDGVAVALGSAAPWSATPDDPGDPSDWPGRASNVWIRHD